jgi:hypothetical protein
MSVTEFVISFIFMAVATMTILVVGTLGAADLLHRPHKRNETEESADSHLERQPEATKAQRDSQLEAASERNADVVEALMPLGSSLSYVRHPNGPSAVGPGADHEDPPHGRAA